MAQQISGRANTGLSRHGQHRRRWDLHTGAFHEGLNLAAVEKVPLVVVVTNDPYAYSTPTSRQFVCEDLVDRAAGYGIPGHSCDGTDLEACLNVIGTGQ